MPKRKQTDVAQPTKRRLADSALSADAQTAAAKESARIDCWLMKSEPESRLENGHDVKFSIDDLKSVGVSPWDGVRNYEARNILRDRMKMGDRALFYHSNCKMPGVAGICEIVREGYPDSSAFEKGHPYFDPKSDPEKPRWYRVDVKFVEKFDSFISLSELKDPKHDHALKNMTLLRRGRLSVQPVTRDEFDYIARLGRGA